MIGTTEIVLIVLAVLLLFGGRKIPELARGLGSSMSEFQKALRGETKEEKPKKKTTSSKKKK